MFQWERVVRFSLFVVLLLPSRIFINRVYAFVKTLICSQHPTAREANGNCFRFSNRFDYIRSNVARMDLSRSSMIECNLLVLIN